MKPESTIGALALEPFEYLVRARIEASLCQGLVLGRVEAGPGRAGVAFLSGPGVACSEAPVFRVQPATLDARVVPWFALPGPLVSGGRGRLGAGATRRR